MNVKKDFPIMNRKINGKPLIYLDSGATSQKPKQVIDALKFYYENYNANTHRGVHTLSEEATDAFEKVREKVAKFINAESIEEIIFVRNTTEAINSVMRGFAYDYIKKGDTILTTIMEHHSNIVPWQQLAKAKNIKLNFIKIDKEGNLDLEHFKKLLNKKTKIVSIVHVSNVLGTINPVKQIAKLAHENNSLLIVDGAQSIPHMKIDVKDLDMDFLVFSGHKMCGPTGIGVLYGKKNLLEKMTPFLYGGDMIREVTFDYTNFNILPWKFEAGTPQIAEAVALGSAIDYLNNIGMENIEEYEKELTNYLYKKLSEQKDIKIYGPKNRSSLISFNLGNIHPHDVAAILDSEGIAIRAGHMCAMPLVREVLKEAALCRVSLYFYNTKEEIDKFISALDKVRRTFKI